MPRYRLPLVLTLCAAGVIAGCASESRPAPQTLYGQAVTETLVGNSLYRTGGGWFSSWEYTGYHRDDGTMTGKVWWSDNEEIADGTWEIAPDGHYCRTWNNDWGDGKRGCFRVSRAGDTMVFEHMTGASGGADRYVYHLQPGNPQDL